MVSNRLTFTAAPRRSRLSRDSNSAMIDNAEYSPVEMSAIGGPGLAGMPG